MRPREARETHRTGSQSQKPTRPTGARFKFKIHSSKSKPADAELSSERRAAPLCASASASATSPPPRASVGSLVLVYAARVGVNARHRAAASGMCARARSGFERNGTAGSGFRVATTTSCWPLGSGLWVAPGRGAGQYRVGETATWVCEACDLSPGPGAWLISASGTVARRSPLVSSATGDSEYVRDAVRRCSSAPIRDAAGHEDGEHGNDLYSGPTPKSTPPPCAGSTKRLTNRGHVCAASSVMISLLIDSHDFSCRCLVVLTFQYI